MHWNKLLCVSVNMIPIVGLHTYYLSLLASPSLMLFYWKVSHFQVWNNPLFCIKSRGGKYRERNPAQTANVKPLSSATSTMFNNQNLCIIQSKYAYKLSTTVSLIFHCWFLSEMLNLYTFPLFIGAIFNKVYFVALTKKPLENNETVF